MAWSGVPGEQKKRLRVLQKKGQKLDLLFGKIYLLKNNSYYYLFLLHTRLLDPTTHPHDYSAETMELFLA